ncbi:MAG TPA: hypothetical protein PLP19_15855 [bacterium]|nr:hypothetical protein [bacterium]HPN44967.1 hypothetical protein [bacterium]
MKRTIFLVLLLSVVTAGFAQPLTCTPFIQQKCLYYSSDRVNTGGLGVGAGIQVIHKQNYIVNTDVDVLWANGNAISTRLALGYQRHGGWAPVIFSTFSLLWGDRTETLLNNGQRPATPVWTVGLAGSVLRFQKAHSFVSALETGYGIGPDGGCYYEVTILKTGVNW